MSHVTEPIVFRAATVLVLLAFVVHRAYYTRKYPPPESETVDKLKPGLVTRLSSALSVLALIATAIYVVAPARIAWASLPLPTWLRAVGLVLAGAGFALLEWSHRSLGREWSDQPRLTQSQRLVEGGPYRWIRHPIYASFLLILGSTLLLSANWLVGLAWIMSVGLEVEARIGFEEDRMASHFGDDYRAYAARTGRLFPRLRRPA